MQDPIQIRYAIEVDGNEVKHTAAVDDRRASWNPDVARVSAQDDARSRYGSAADTDSVKVLLMGEPDANYDETWGM